MTDKNAENMKRLVFKDAGNIMSSLAKRSEKCCKSKFIKKMGDWYETKHVEAAAGCESMQECIKPLPSQ